MIQPNKKLNAQKKQRESYSGKHKCHTIKEQLIINGATGQIICVHQAKGSVHDLELFRQSGVRLNRFILVVGDKGYQGICGLHEYSLTPYKKTKGGKLTSEQKAFNSALSKFRILIEHVNRRIQRFKMFQCRYRNKQLMHHKHFSLICAVHNFELGLV